MGGAVAGDADDGDLVGIVVGRPVGVGGPVAVGDGHDRAVAQGVDVVAGGAGWGGVDAGAGAGGAVGVCGAVVVAELAVAAHPRGTGSADGAGGFGNLLAGPQRVRRNLLSGHGDRGGSQYLSRDV